MIEIPALVTSTWTVLQPFLPIIATKAAEEIGKTAVAKIWTAIEKKFDTKAAAKEALEDLLKSPQSEDAHVVFRVQLKKLLEDDSAFASDLFKLVESVGSEYKAQIIGDGAIAQGTGAKAVGAGGIMIEGGVTGDSNTFNSGKDKKK